MAADYEYRGLMAQAWDLLRGDTSGWGDRAWFRTVVERGRGPALDVGCGTGRLLLDYLAAGLDVDGVDNSPEMLALCREKAQAAGLDVAGRLHLGAMQIPRPAPPLRDHLRALDVVPAAARSGGRQGRARRLPRPPGSRAASSRSRSGPRRCGTARDRRRRTGGGRSGWSTPRPRDPTAPASAAGGAPASTPAQQLVDEVFRYEVIEDGAVTRSEEQGHVPTLRWYSLDQALALVAEAGFIDLVATSDSSFEPASAADGRFKIVGKRP